jgi:hypothetical protein
MTMRCRGVAYLVHPNSFDTGNLHSFPRINEILIGAFFLLGYEAIATD